MRTTDVLVDDFEDIKILQQYLYMWEDNFVDVYNTINVILRIRMNEDLNYYCKNMNFPDGEETCYSGEMTNEVMLSIIEQLKESSAIEFPNSFSSRWDEIRHLCAATITKSLMNRKK